MTLPYVHVQPVRAVLLVLCQHRWRSLMVVTDSYLSMCWQHQPSQLQIWRRANWILWFQMWFDERLKDYQTLLLLFDDKDLIVIIGIFSSFHNLNHFYSIWYCKDKLSEECSIKTTYSLTPSPRGVALLSGWCRQGGESSTWCLSFRVAVETDGRLPSWAATQPTGWCHWEGCCLPGSELLNVLITKHSCFYLYCVAALSGIFT